MEVNLAKIYLYSNIPSNGAKDLVHAIGATRLRKFDGMDFWIKNKKIQLSPGDAIICWGRLLPELDGIKILNPGKNLSKLDEMWALVNSGIPTITIKDTATKPSEGFIARSKYHVGGNDLLNTPARPDFYAKKEPLVKEYRIHSFNQRSIRAGVKQPRDGFQVVGSEADFKLGLDAHPWIRSYDGGWRINYDDFQSTKDLRELAHKAVKALKLNFGAVDIGERADGTRLVLEVNKAPGLEGGTLEAYKRAIEKWLEVEPKEEVKKEAEPAKPAAPYVNPLDAREQRYGAPRWPRAGAQPVRPGAPDMPTGLEPQVIRWIDAQGNMREGGGIGPQAPVQPARPRPMAPPPVHRGAGVRDNPFPVPRPNRNFGPNEMNNIRREAEARLGRPVGLDEVERVERDLNINRG